MAAAHIVHADQPDVYQPALTPPEFIEPFQKHVEPGHDEFPEERTAEEIEARLAGFGGALKTGTARAADSLAGLLAPGFRGGVLSSPDPASPAGTGPLQVRHDAALPAEPAFDAQGFAGELRRLLSGVGRVDTTEFLVTAIAPPSPDGTISTDIRYDIVGSGTSAFRVQHTGTWRILWRRSADGWRAAQWTAASHTASQANRPLFTEVTGAALAANESFVRQFGTGLDEWMTAFDSVLTRDSNGHHGVSVGDADGDGLDDLYIAQPSGLPNRLYRNRGDGTFEDVTDGAGVGVLDDTPMALFADVDNDGDQDLVVAAATGLLLFANDGRARFTPVSDAFEFVRPLEGSITGIAMADYDRDGFLDLYVCVYSYFYGAGEDKAGTPMPYHDARNGPPGVLFRNDGAGRFVDVTTQAGLDEGNDRYHFAAAWADYDEDGYADLLVVNDFGTNNLYRNRGNGTFEDVAERAGVLDHAAGMSAAFLDYDNDGRLDIYTGNMWTASGLRVTASPAFMPSAAPDVRALYRRHARGNSLFRNRGDGTFQDVTEAAGAAMGRWAWSSDAVDVDSDGWDDLLVVNGMLTRAGAAAARDLESFFWRQVVARSPLARSPGTPYDDAWRTINQWLIHGSIAGGQRNVLLRNDGRGHFQEVAGAAGLDLDQDGRSFGILDLDGDGDPDLVFMAARQAPQLRIFRNDVAAGGRALAIRLTGTKSNRDAVGARVVIETDRFTRTRVVHAGSGFLSQHSKELLVGLGDSQRVATLTVHWPSGETQAFTDVPLDTRFRLVEGGTLETAGGWQRSSGTPAFARGYGGKAGTSGTPAFAQGYGGQAGTWLYEPFPAPEFSVQDAGGGTWSLASLQGSPALVLAFRSGAPLSRAALDALSRGGRALSAAGIKALAIALDAPDRARPVEPAAAGGVPVAHAGREAALALAILNRHLFMNRQPLTLPTAFLLDGGGRVVKVYRERLDAAQIVADAAAVDAPPDVRLRRAVPFDGTFYAALPMRNYLPYGRELMDQGLDAAAVAAFERAAQASPSASTLYRLGTLLTRAGETARARAAYERALDMEPDFSEAHNDLGTLLARGGDLEGAIARFRAALEAAPDYPDALNNLGYALLLTGDNGEARRLYERALALQPDFPEALNNLGLLHGRAGELDEAGRYFSEALARRPDYGEAANNMALVLVARGRQGEAVSLLEGLLARSPAFEPGYITLAKLHLAAGRTAEGLAVLERLLQRNATHPVALQLVREWKAH